MNLWRIYFFDEQMNIVEMIDRLTARKPSAYAARHARSNGYYTYAIGALR